MSNSGPTHRPPAQPGKAPDSPVRTYLRDAIHEATTNPNVRSYALACALDRLDLVGLAEVLRSIERMFESNSAGERSPQDPV